MAEVHIKINNQFVTAEEGDTILEAANKSGIQIPTLCYLKNVIRSGACRVCLVEVKGARALLSACTTPVSEGMEVGMLQTGCGQKAETETPSGKEAEG